MQCNDTSVSIKYRIKSGDKDNFFKAEAERVGDFVFLMIRTKTNNLDVLNRERRSSYRLDIRAKSRGPDQQRLKIPESRTFVDIEVTDSNDLDPFFQPSTYFFDVPEDIALHSVFGQVKAEDADSGINGEIYYSIMDSGDDEKIFAVDPITGGLSVTRPLSFYSAPKHELSIVAQDRGAKSRFATRAPDTATVYVSVTQVGRFSAAYYDPFCDMLICCGGKAPFLQQRKEGHCIPILNVINISFLALEFLQGENLKSKFL